MSQKGAWSTGPTAPTERGPKTSTKTSTYIALDEEDRHCAEVHGFDEAVRVQPAAVGHCGEARRCERVGVRERIAQRRPRLNANEATRWFVEREERASRHFRRCALLADVLFLLLRAHVYLLVPSIAIVALAVALATALAAAATTTVAIPADSTLEKENELAPRRCAISQMQRAAQHEASRPRLRLRPHPVERKGHRDIVVRSVRAAVRVGLSHHRIVTHERRALPAARVAARAEVVAPVASGEAVADDEIRSVAP